MNMNDQPNPQFVPAPLQTIRAAYAELGRRVTVALRTQIGDHARLGEERRHCLRLSALVTQASSVVPSHILSFAQTG
jgi:hypothetical protein